MKGGLAAAWLVAVGLVTYRQVKGNLHLPVPGSLLAVTGLFAGLGLVADIYPRSATFVTVTAVGLDVAGVLNLWPAGLGGQVGQAVASGQPGAGAAAGAAAGSYTGAAAGGA